MGIGVLVTCCIFIGIEARGISVRTAVAESSRTTAPGALCEALDMNPAPIEPNNDDDFDPEEIEAAVEEGATPANAPEVDSKTENLTEWDQPAAASSSAPKTPLEDEAALPEELTEEGIEEADREQRIASVDPDYEP